MKPMHKQLIVSCALFIAAWTYSVEINQCKGSPYANATFDISDLTAISRKPRPKPKPKPTTAPKPTAQVTPKPSLATAVVQSTGKKKLTLMIYMAGDNNLEPFIDINRKQIEREGVDPDMNLLLFICTHRRNEPKLATKAIVQDHKTTILERVNGLDSGKKETLMSACSWAAQYEADNMAVILWDHGSGPLNKYASRGICYDNTTRHFLTDSDLYDTFNTVTKTYLNNKKLAFIGFDACLMGAIEIASVIKPFADYMVSSEHTIQASGWPYDKIMKSFKQHKTTLDQFIKNDIVNAYQAHYDPLMQDYTLSCVDLTHIDPLIENVNAISKVLVELIKLQKGNSILTTLGDIAAETTRFDEPAYADLYDWYTHIMAKADLLQCTKPEDTNRLVTRLKFLATQGILLVKQAVVGNVQGSIFDQTHGMLVYLPERYVDKTYLSTQWAQKTDWLSFLRAYLKQPKNDEPV